MSRHLPKLTNYSQIFLALGWFYFLLSWCQWRKNTTTIHKYGNKCHQVFSTWMEQCHLPAGTKQQSYNFYSLGHTLTEQCSNQSSLIMKKTEDDDLHTFIFPSAQDLIQRVESPQYVRVSIWEQRLGRRGGGRGGETRRQGARRTAQHGGTHSHPPAQFDQLTHTHEQQQRWDNTKQMNLRIVGLTPGSWPRYWIPNPLLPYLQRPRIAPRDLIK